MSTDFQVLPRASRQLSYSSLLPYVLSLPRAVRKCQALYVPQGQGETERVDEAIYLWETSPNLQRLLVAGANPDEDGFLSAEQLEDRFRLSQREGVRTQETAKHSRAQVDWAARLCQEEDIRDLAVLAPPYHLLRQMLMMYSALKRQGILIPLIPTPMRVPPGNVTLRTLAGETDVRGIQMVDGELERCVEYCEQYGDVPPAEEFYEYLQWLWTQPIIQMTDY